MSFRILADDGSVHVFPDGTDTSVIGSTVARYHAACAQNGNAPSQLPSATTISDSSDKQMPMSADMSLPMRGNSNRQISSYGSGPPSWEGLLSPWQIPDPALASGVPPTPNAASGSAPIQTRPQVVPVPKPLPGPIAVTPALRAAIGPVPGYPETGGNAWRAWNDNAFQRAANDYNADHGYASDDPAYLPPALMKAWAMQESGGNRGVFATDPFRANVLKDWPTDNTKAAIANLARGQTMNPATSADAALKWMRYKMLLNNLPDNSDISQGLRTYNGRTDLRSDGNRFSDDYMSGILNLYAGMQKGN